MKRYELQSAWPNGAQWEWVVINSETGRVAFPEHGYASKAECQQWVDEMNSKEEN